MTGTSPGELWEHAGGDREEYRRLLAEHGHLLGPGDPGYEQASRTLPCGWDPGKTREQQDRCEITDLLRASCAHCTGAPGLPSAGWGPWFTARRHGTCAGGCGEPIGPGDRIRADGEGGYLCETCGDQP